MVWKKGQSGNPNGRPRVKSALVALVQKKLQLKNGENKAVNGLLKIATNPKVRPADRKAAWELLLAYGYGRPPQKLEHTGEDGSPLMPSVAIYIPDHGRDREKKKA